MFIRTKGCRWIQAFLVVALSAALPVAGEEAPAASETNTHPSSLSPATAPVSEIEQLRRMILDQQRQIDELRAAMAGQAKADQSVAAAAQRQVHLRDGMVVA